MTRCHCRIEYRGRAYDSWQALADDYGLSAFCALNRIDRGMPLDLPKQKNGVWVLKPVGYGGRKYPSMHGLDVWGATPDEVWANWWRAM